MFRHLMHGPVALTLLLIWIAIVVLALGLYRLWPRREPRPLAPVPQKYAHRLGKRLRDKRLQSKRSKESKAGDGQKGSGS